MQTRGEMNVKHTGVNRRPSLLAKMMDSGWWRSQRALINSFDFSIVWVLWGKTPTTTTNSIDISWSLIPSQVDGDNNQHQHICQHLLKFLQNEWVWKQNHLDLSYQIPLRYSCWWVKWLVCQGEAFLKWRDPAFCTNWYPLAKKVKKSLTQL